MKLPRITVGLTLRISAVLTLLALALMVWSLLDPTVLPVMVAMSVGQGIGTIAFAAYGFVVFRDLTRKRAERRASQRIEILRNSMQLIPVGKGLEGQPTSERMEMMRDSMQLIPVLKQPTSKQIERVEEKQSTSEQREETKPASEPREETEPTAEPREETEPTAERVDAAKDVS